MFIAPRAEYFARLDYLRGQAIAMIVIIRTLACRYKLRCDSQQRQIPLLLDGVGAEYFEKFRECTFRQSLDVVVTGEDGTVSLAKGALEHLALGGVVLAGAALGGGGRRASEELMVTLLLLDQHELLSFFFGESSCGETSFDIFFFKFRSCFLLFITKMVITLIIISPIFFLFRSCHRC